MYIVLVFVAIVIIGAISLTKHNIEEEKPKQTQPEKPVLSHKVLSHCLFYGPAGLGKTTLANVVQKECEKIYGHQTNFLVYTPSNLYNQQAVLDMIDKITYGCIVFIDEIHGLEVTIEESLYSVMQDFKYFAEGITIEIPRFTLIGATTLAGKINKPLRDRFSILIELDPIKNEDLVKISDNSDVPSSFDTYQGQQTAKQLLKMHMFALKKEEFNKIDNDVSEQIAKRSFGNPRIYKQIQRHVVAFQTLVQSTIQEQNLKELFDLLSIDEFGLDKADRRVIAYLSTATRPVGEAALANSAGVPKEDYIGIIEPKLESLKFIVKTARGRELSALCKETYLNANLYR